MAERWACQPDSPRTGGNGILRPSHLQSSDFVGVDSRAVDGTTFVNGLIEKGSLQPPLNPLKTDGTVAGVTSSSSLQVQSQQDDASAVPESLKPTDSTSSKTQSSPFSQPTLSSTHTPQGGSGTHQGTITNQRGTPLRSGITRGGLPQRQTLSPTDTSGLPQPVLQQKSSDKPTSPDLISHIDPLGFGDPTFLTSYTSPSHRIPQNLQTPHLQFDTSALSQSGRRDDFTSGTGQAFNQTGNHYYENIGIAGFNDNASELRNRPSSGRFSRDQNNISVINDDDDDDDCLILQDFSQASRDSKLLTSEGSNPFLSFFSKITGGDSKKSSSKTAVPGAHDNGADAHPDFFDYTRRKESLKKGSVFDGGSKSVQQGPHAKNLSSRTGGRGLQAPHIQSQQNQSLSSNSRATQQNSRQNQGRGTFLNQEQLQRPPPPSLASGVRPKAVFHDSVVTDDILGLHEDALHGESGEVLVHTTSSITGGWGRGQYNNNSSAGTTMNFDNVRNSHGQSSDRAEGQIYSFPRNEASKEEKDEEEWEQDRLIGGGEEVVPLLLDGGVGYAGNGNPRMAVNGRVPSTPNSRLSDRRVPRGEGGNSVGRHNTGGVASGGDWHVNHHGDTTNPLPQLDNPEDNMYGATTASVLHCHKKRMAPLLDQMAKRQLVAVVILCLLFMIGEGIGGYLANSLALFTDVLHLGSDLISFIISLLAIYLSNKPATRRMSFGYHRAEVLGALFSVFLIWLVSGVLCYIAVERITHEHYKDVKPNEMLITASIGVVCNVIMAFVLHSETCCSKAHSHTKFGHGHSHGGGGGHGHSHGGGGHGHSHGGGGGHGHSHGHSHGRSPSKARTDHEEGWPDYQQLQEVTEFEDHTDPLDNGILDRRHSDDSLLFPQQQRVTESEDVEWRRIQIEREDRAIHKHKNINVRAAFIHVIGDIIQSMGVLVAALIIKFTSDDKFRLADPICTFVFSLLVLITTIAVLRDALLVMMEGVPRDLSYERLKLDLKTIPRVKAVHSLHIWALTMDRNAVSVHLAIEPEASHADILSKATRLIQEEYHFFHSTIQVELYNEEFMTSCNECTELN